MDTKTTTYRGYVIETHNPGQSRHTWHDVPGLAQKAHNEPGCPITPAFRTLKLAKAFIDRRFAEKEAAQAAAISKMTVLYTFFHGHVDDLGPQRFQVIFDLFNPPWRKGPVGIPYQVEPVELVK